ncbi:hypothetical protein V497_00068 [Pseudogymnoascus sp. VKM F-4516 (FW-969)]|nr:hypothetical protein V497_00068 [Pseudogymnoascus sp. VKM F-4516 (FW-969)]
MSAPLAVPAMNRHTATVIFLHGLGDQGAGWIDLAVNWRRRQKFTETKFIFPNAPSIPITLNGGMRMPGWYDIVRARNTTKAIDDFSTEEDEAGIMRSRTTVHRLIDAEIAAGISSERIIIGGFSQGGAMSLLSGATCEHKLGGIVALSGYMLLKNKFKDLVPEGNPNKDTDIFMGHGDQDPLVLTEWGRMTAAKMSELGWKVDLKIYPGLKHSAAPKEIDDFEDYLHVWIPDLEEGPAHLATIILTAAWLLYRCRIGPRSTAMRRNKLDHLRDPGALGIANCGGAMFLSRTYFLSAFFTVTGLALAIIFRNFWAVVPAVGVKQFGSTLKSRSMSTATRTPVYFVSHGGPNIMYETSHPAYSQLASLGRKITTTIKPKAVLVLSAHWEGTATTISVNTAPSTPLIYDFGGFPSHYYRAAFPHTGSPQLAHSALRLLTEAGISAQPATRGLDHGVWVPFSILFNPDTNPLSVPIVQLSLFGSDSGDAHYALGEALAPLRDEGVLIIVSGQAVHNLRDFFSSRGSPTPLNYAVAFDEALKGAVEADPSVRKEKMGELLKRGDARKAHPSFEHLLPVFVGAGAAGKDKGVRLWTLCEGSISWGMFRFGDEPGESAGEKDV